jgi:predicted choloylglycine hydrolase
LKEEEFQRAISYFRRVPVEGIKNVYMVSVIGNIATVSYTGPRGNVRTNEFDLSRQHMKMFMESKDG